ncbi:hypothetical protein [Hymenobacter terrenus]|uniref:hypothetical protein n=1 Tax=Hymenobacter terrenus TaxID=1629124 RepID=UPI000AB79A10|nr:hypothetical protein [Hymenobacter terrenus]
MRFPLFRSAGSAWLALPAFAATLLLGSCNSQPTATEADKTATVIPSDTNAASDSAATTAPAADSASAAGQ